MTVVEDRIYILEARINRPREPWVAICWAPTQPQAQEEQARREHENRATSYRISSVDRLR